MYSPDHRDTVEPLEGVPRCEAGAPLPAVVAHENFLALVYIEATPAPEDWDGTSVEVVGHDTPDKPIAMVDFSNPYAHMFGPPNDEAFSGHPLAARGLEPYSASEVRNSSWIRELIHANSVHPYHDAKQFSAYRHFVFAFHDSTFECIAEDYRVDRTRGSISQVLLEVCARAGHAA
jgi:hypothetical protein